MQQMHSMQQSPAMINQKRLQAGQANAQSQPFPPQLQHQMQASPLNMNSQNLMSMNASNMGNAQTPQQPNQQPQQGVSGAPQQQQPTLSPADNAQINALATKLMQGAPKERVEQIKIKFLNLSQEQQDMVRQKYGNPVLLHFRQEAQKLWMAQRNRQQLQAQMDNQRANGAGVNPAMGQNPLLLRNPQQASASQNVSGAMSGQDFDISQIAGQQADALRSQDAGQLVVPASNNNMNLNQQVSGMPMGLNQGGTFNQQGMGVTGQMPTGLQLQQNFLNPQQAQHAQQLRLRMAHAQAQAQAQAQQNLQRQQNQHMGMNAQMAGMGSQTPQPSPMALLTQPVSQPNQPGGATPQRPQSTMPQLQQGPNQPDPRALQALQQAQDRANALGAPNQPFQAGIRRQLPTFVQSLPDQVKVSLATMNDEAYQLAIQRLQAQRMNAPGGFPGGQMQGLQRGQVPTPQPQGLGQIQPPGIVTGNQQPGPMANQGHMPNTALNEQAHLQRLQHQMLQQSNLPPNILQQLDQKPFPPSLVHANNFSVPEHVRTWSQLKLWVLQNRNSVPQTFTVVKVLQLQLRLLQQQHVAQGRTNQGQNGGVMPQSGLPIAASMPGPAMQTMPNMQPQQQIPPTNLPQTWQVIPVSPEEIMMFRQKHPQAQTSPEDQLRIIIQRHKFERLQKTRLQQQQHQQQAAAQQAQQQQQQQQQQQSFAQQNNMQQIQIPPQPAQPQRPMSQMPQQPLQRQPSQPPSQRQGIPPSANMAISTSQMPGPRQPSVAASVQQGVKRQATDDLMETSQPVASAVPMQSTMSQQQPPSGVSQHVQLGQQNRASVNAPFPPKPSIPQEELERRYQLLLKQSEDPNYVPKRPPGPILPEARQRLIALLKETARFIPELDNCIRLFFMNTADEKQTKQYFKARQVLRENVDFKDFSLAQNLTQNPRTVEITIEQIKKFVTQITMKFKPAKVRGQSSTLQDATGVVATPNQQQLLSGPQNEAITAQQQMSNSPAQLNAVNLQQHTKAHQRKQPNIKPPAAPTTERGQFPPFDASPVREPTYAGPQRFTTSDLKIPAKKKQKVGQTATPSSTSTQPTPAAQPSPQVVKTPSPEIPRKAPDVKVEAPKPVIPTMPVMPFKCVENNCNNSFATQADLDAHKKEAHVVIKDFIAYELENLAEAIGLNKDGSTKTSDTAKDGESQKASAKTSGSGKNDSPSTRAAQAGKGPTSAPADTKSSSATDKLADEIDKAADIDDPWANSLLKPAEIAEIFHPVDTLINPAFLNFNPTRDELITAGIISADRPPTPSPDDVPDLSDPNTTPSPASKDASTVAGGAAPAAADAPSLDLPSWVADDWAWPMDPAKQWDDESVYFEPEECSGSGKAEPEPACPDLALWDVDWVRAELFVGPTGHPDDVVPLSEAQRARRDAERAEKEAREARERETRAKDPAALKKWEEEERERAAKRAEEIERLKFLKTRDVPGWEDTLMEDFVAFDH